MGDVLDNLFSIIPIVLAILWVMRRASRKKSGGKAAQTQSGSSSESPARTKPEQSRLSQRLHNLEKRATKAVRNVRDEIITKENPPGEEVLYEPLESKSAVAPRRHPQMEDTVERLVEDRSKADEEKKYSGPEISNSFDRFRELPPLAQGMVWSIILDEPPALKEPKN